jgi:DNA-binding MarR family transcriptional regulator
MISAPPTTHTLAEAGTAAPGTDLAGPARDAAPHLSAAIGKLSRTLRRTSSVAGMTPSETAVLLTIVHEGPIGLSDLAGIEAINPTMLSRITARLAEARLIERNPDPRDRRAVIVQPTPEGVRVRGEIQAARTRALQQHIARLSVQERDALSAAIPALERLAELIGQTHSP